MSKHNRVRKLMFPGIIAGLTLAVISFSAAITSGAPVKEVNASLTNNGYDTGEYQYYSGSYYDSIGDSAISSGGTTLISKLKTLIQPSSAFGYANIWTFNEQYDCYPSDYDGTDPLTGNAYPTTNNTTKRGKMWDMYSDQNWTSVTDRCGSYSTVGDKYNREHSMPKSWFGGSESNQPGTDPNHLFNTDGKVNGVRSNYAYGEVTTVKTNCYTLNSSVVGFGKLGTNSSGTTVFEPDDAYKGDFARAQMYMATAYYDWNLTQGSGESTACFTYSGGVSTMKDYYINLLTKWSEEDPVSQKEINRNNSVYSQQGNRNPFIDHPGWANKIWGGTEYTWGKSSSTTPTISLNKSSASIAVGGTISLTATAANGSGSVTWSKGSSSAVTLSATSGNSITVTGAAAGTATITASYSGVTATCTVTVTSSGTTSYTVTFNANGHGTAPSSQTVASGGLVTEPTAPTASGYTFGGWYKEATCTNAWNFSTDTITAATILYAKWTASSSGSGNYEKVSSSSDFSTGQYLIVYETGSLAFDGSLSTLDATSNNISVTISNSTITSTSTIDASSFTIGGSSGNYTIQSASGKYIGTSSNSNGLTASDSELTNSITIESSGDATIVSSGGAYLRYNSSSDQARFRYYKSSSYSSQKAIQLYKKASSSGDTTEKTLSSISLNTSSVTTSFEVGDSFSYTGLVVTANYSDNSSATVTPTSVSSPDMSSAGTKTVTVSYTENSVTKTASYSITVTESSGGDDPTPTTNSIKAIYDGGVGTYDFEGLYVGVTNGSPVIMNGEYGMLLYGVYSSTYSSWTVNESYISVSATITTYKNLYETDKNSTITVSATKTDTSVISKVANPKTYTVTGNESSSDLSVANRLSHVVGTVYSINGTTGTSGWSTSSDNTVIMTVGSKQVQVFVKKSYSSDTTIANAFKSGEEITVEGFTSFYSTTFQVAFSSIVETDTTYLASTFAQELLDLVSPICTGYDGVTDNSNALNGVWTTLEGSDHYLKLSSEQKTILQEADVNESGTVIEQAMAFYDKAVAKYHLTNFINRTISYNENVFFTSTTDNTILTIVLISVVSVSVIGGFIFLKKKRENY